MPMICHKGGPPGPEEERPAALPAPAPADATLPANEAGHEAGGEAETPGLCPLKRLPSSAYAAGAPVFGARAPRLFLKGEAGRALMRRRKAAERPTAFLLPPPGRPLSGIGPEALADAFPEGDLPGCRFLAGPAAAGRRPRAACGRPGALSPGSGRARRLELEAIWLEGRK